MDVLLLKSIASGVSKPLIDAHEHDPRMLGASVMDDCKGLGDGVKRDLEKWLLIIELLLGKHPIGKHSSSKSLYRQLRILHS